MEDATCDAPDGGDKAEGDAADWSLVCLPSRTRRAISRLAGPAVIVAVLTLSACGGTPGLRKLDATQIGGLKVGDSSADVTTKLGPAANVEKRDRFGREVWTYHYSDRSQVRANRVAYLYFDPSTGRITSIETGINLELYPDAN